MDFFVEDCEFDTPRGPTPYGRQLRGKDQVREGIAARFEGIPDISYEDEVHWACGDHGVSQWTIRGTTSDGAKIEALGLLLHHGLLRSPRCPGPQHDQGPISAVDDPQTGQLV